MILLKWVLKGIGWNDVDWMNLAVYRDKCQAVL
jgi:hypothetical protein